MDEFMGSFDACHAVHLLPIYAASEAAIEGVTAAALQQGMVRRGHRCVQLCVDLDDARGKAEEALKQGDVVMLLGAGSIGHLAAEMRRSREHHG